MAVMRPLIVPGPSQRASILPNVVELIFTWENICVRKHPKIKVKYIFLMTAYLKIALIGCGFKHRIIDRYIDLDFFDLYVITPADIHGHPNAFRKFLVIAVISL